MNAPTNFRELFEHLEVCPRVRIHGHGLEPFEADFYHRDTSGRLWFRSVSRRRPGPGGKVFSVAPDGDLTFESTGFTTDDWGVKIRVEYLE